MKLTLAPIWLPHWPAWIWTISRILFVVFSRLKTYLKKLILQIANNFLIFLQREREFRISTNLFKIRTQIEDCDEFSAFNCFWASGNAQYSMLIGRKRVRNRHWRHFVWNDVCMQRRLCVCVGNCWPLLHSSHIRRGILGASVCSRRVSLHCVCVRRPPFIR